MPTGKRRGAQPGHPPRLRLYIPAARLSRRGAKEAGQAAFGVPISPGSACHLERETSEAPAPAHAAAVRAARQAASKHVGEAGWREARQGRWLRVAAAATEAALVARVRRGLGGLRALPARGAVCGHAGTAATGRDLLPCEGPLWTFAADRTVTSRVLFSGEALRGRDPKGAERSGKPRPAQGWFGEGQRQGHDGADHPGLPDQEGVW
jgi:hypothetical protein